MSHYRSSGGDVLIFAVAIFAILQIPSQVPRKIAQNQSAQTKNDETASTHKKTPASPVPVRNLGQSRDSQNDRKTVTSKDKRDNALITVTPVSVRKDPWDYASILASLLIAGTSLVLAITAWIQAKAARRSADNDERAVRLTERADVLLESISLSTVQQLSPQTQFILRIKNFGRTRANNVKTTFYVGDPGTPVSLPPGPPTTTVLGAGDGQNVPLPQLGQFLTAPTFNGVASGQIPLRVYGTIAYTDVFGDRHTVNCKGTFEAADRNFSVDENRVD